MAMKNNIIVKTVLAAGVLLVLGGTARAGGSTGIGVGGDLLLDGAGGVAVTYDADKFRLQGILGFLDVGDETTVLLAGRGFVPVHSTAMADFSLGGSLGLSRFDPGPGDGVNIVIIEALGQARAFVTSNFSLNFTLGFGVETSDGDAILVDSGINGSAGFTYFFY